MTRQIFALSFAVTAALLAAGLFNAAPRQADAHCQVPCGIFDDPARITLMLEDATTIAKSARLMNELTDKNDTHSKQQFVRWTKTKEEHAQRIIDTVADYFLAQKVKPVAPGSEGYDAYLQQLADHHAVIVAAMKAKQSADPAAAENLNEAIHALGHTWAPGPAE